jgi:hypothetical protein
LPILLLEPRELIILDGFVTDFHYHLRAELANNMADGIFGEREAFGMLRRVFR